MSEYPLATDGLVKGSIIAPESIEFAFGVIRDTPKYQLACLRAIAYITKRFADRGEDVFVKQEKHSLRVLTDEEAPAYAAKRFREGIKAARTAHMKQLGADRSQMTEATRAIHDLNLVRQGGILQAIQVQQRYFRPVKAARQTPGLPEGTKKV